jgi:hypothetical protein
LSQVTDVKGPDGVTVLYHGTGIKQDCGELKKRFIVLAKK